MAAPIIALILASAITFEKKHPRVDVLEINTYVFPNGNEKFTQVIFWRWYGPLDSWGDPGHHVADWRVIQGWRVYPGTPNRSVWVKTNMDGWYEIPYRDLRFTRTFHDPEVADRKRLSESERISYYEECEDE